MQGYDRSAAEISEGERKRAVLRVILLITLLCAVVTTVTLKYTTDNSLRTSAAVSRQFSDSNFNFTVFEIYALKQSEPDQTGNMAMLYLSLSRELS